MQVALIIQNRATFVVKYILKRKFKVKQVKKDELLCAVAVYMALREHRVPMTYREVADHCHKVKEKEICRIFKIYERSLCMGKIKVLDLTHVNYKLMVPRFCGMLGMEFLEQKKVRQRMTKVDKACVDLKALNPMTKFAVAVKIEYPDTDLDNLHIVCGVSKHTIMKSVALLNNK
tara:strand:+ start:4357 stop:4881 length:525 start_codon:yes stop_codon:yes gene_type:complete